MFQNRFESKTALAPCNKGRRTFSDPVSVIRQDAFDALMACQHFDAQGDALNYGWCGAHAQFVKLYHPAGEFWSQCQFKALTRDRSTGGDEGTRL